MAFLLHRLRLLGRQELRYRIPEALLCRETNLSVYRIVERIVYDISDQ